MQTSRSLLHCPDRCLGCPFRQERFNTLLTESSKTHLPHKRGEGKVHRQKVHRLERPGPAPSGVPLDLTWQCQRDDVQMLDQAGMKAGGGGGERSLYCTLQLLRGTAACLQPEVHGMPAAATCLLPSLLRLAIAQHVSISLLAAQVGRLCQAPPPSPPSSPPPPPLQCSSFLLLLQAAIRRCCRLQRRAAHWLVSLPDLKFCVVMISEAL